MITINQFASITSQMAQTNANLNALAFNYKEVAPRTELDVAHIDLLVAQAQQMILAAESLKTIAYDPTPEESAP